MIRDNKFTTIIIIMIIFTFTSLFISIRLFNYTVTIIWVIAMSFMFLCGIYFSIKLRFIQFKFRDQIKSLKSKNDNKSLNSINTLCMSLSSKVGVGSIAGVALAIYLGGSGVVFWLWISAIITSVNAYVESYFGRVYNTIDYGKIYKGGPSYYIKYGLKKNLLAYIYAFLIIFSYIGCFLSIQSNTIVVSVSNVSNISSLIVILIVCLATALIIFKDVKFLAKFSSMIVPIMGIIYLILGIYIVIINIDKMPNIIISIFKNAFSIKAGIGGFFTTMILGIQRGIFASEAGIGTSAISSSSSIDSPKKQGLSQIFGIYLTVFIICNITAFIILTSTYNTLDIIKPNGIEITLYAFEQNLGHMGSIILCIITILFAFSTIISGYYYGESGLKFVFPNISKNKINLFKILTIFIVLLGCILSANIIWKLVDILVAFLAIINIYAILKLFDKS